MQLEINIPNWMNKSEYPNPDELPLSGWCWEFIRRNPEYQNDWIAQNVYLSENPIQQKQYRDYLQSIAPPRELDINTQVYELAKKWGFNIVLPNPNMDYYKLNHHSIWPIKRYKPEIIFPTHERNHEKYSLHENFRLALIFSLDESWNYQIDTIRNQLNNLSQKHGDFEKLPQHDLSRLLPTYEKPYVNSNHKPVSELNDDILLITGLTPYKEATKTNNFSISIRLSKPSVKAFITLIPRIKAQFKKHQQKNAYTQKADRNKLPTYLRTIDAISCGTEKSTIGQTLFPDIYIKTRHADTITFTNKVNDTIAGAYRFRDDLAVKLLKSRD